MAHIIFRIAFPLSLFVLFISLVMLCPHRLSKTNKEIISKCGLLHFTTEEAAKKILSMSVIKAGVKDRHTYFFQNSTVSMGAISYNKLKNKKVKIEILNLTEQQLDHLRIRYFDMAIEYKGDFFFSVENQVSIKNSSDISPICTNLFFYNRIARIMLYVSATLAILLLMLIEYL